MSMITDAYRGTANDAAADHGGLLGRIRIAPKVMACIAVLGVVALGLSVFSLRKLDETKASLEDIAATRAVRVRLAQDIQTLMEGIARNEKNVILEDEDDKIAAFNRELGTQRARLQETVARLEPMIAPERRHVFAEFRLNLKSWLEHHERAVALGTENSENHASAIVRAEAAPALVQALKPIEALLQSSGARLETLVGDEARRALIATRLLLDFKEIDLMQRQIMDSSVEPPEAKKLAAEIETRIGDVDQARSILSKLAPEATAAMEKSYLAWLSAQRKAMAEGLKKTNAQGYEISKNEARVTQAKAMEKIDFIVDANVKGMDAAVTTARSDYDRNWTLIVSATAIGLVASLFGAWLVSSRGVTGPLARITAAMKRLAGGDKAVAVPGTKRADEVGDIARALLVFKDNMIEADRLRDEQEALKAQAEADKKAALARMADAFEASVGGVVEAVSSAATEMQSSAQALTATAEETSSQSTAVAAASEQASTNVQTVSSATEELSSSIEEISRQVAESTTIAATAVGEANATQGSIRRMAEAANAISDVVTLISDVASQTNLLALNATIEAARAGEMGKGFAVVASEVKSLATQTAKATEDIRQQIQGVQSAAEGSVKAIEAISATIGRLSEIATTIAAAIEEQGAATKEIARNVQQAAQGTGEVSSNIGAVSQAAQETGAAASQVLGAAGELAQQSETLRAELDKFLSGLRAA